MLKVLVVEDAPNVRDRLVNELSHGATGYEVVVTDNRTEAIRLLASEEPNLVMLDLIIPPSAGEPAADWTEGRSVLRFVKRHLPHIKVIVLTSRGDLARDFLVEEGADDFFTKDAAEAWRHGKLLGQLEALIGCVACRSASMQRTRRQFGSIREDDPLILIEGEVGTGKKYLASILHRCSQRARKRFEHLTCATLDAAVFLPQLVGVRGGGTTPYGSDRIGLLESPDVGTILMDGIDELEEEAQEQLARLLAGARRSSAPGQGGAIRFRPVGGVETLASDARLILTLTESPGRLSAPGRLIDALEVRLDPARFPSLKHIVVPPLRERKEDLPDLARFLLTRHALAVKRPELRWDERCLDLLLDFDFPGNVAQLEWIIAAASQLAEGDIVLPQHLELPLPEEYVVRFNRGAGVEEKRISRVGLAELTDPEKFDLVVELADDGSAAQTNVKSNVVIFSDSRLGSLLILLMQRAGEPVDLKEHRRRLGIAMSDPLKRYVFRLRQALGDTQVTNRSSRFITSHYGERYSFNADCRFALVRRLRDHG